MGFVFPEGSPGASRVVTVDRPTEPKRVWCPICTVNPQEVRIVTAKFGFGFLDLEETSLWALVQMVRDWPTLRAGQGIDVELRSESPGHVVLAFDTLEAW